MIPRLLTIFAIIAALVSALFVPASREISSKILKQDISPEDLPKLYPYPVLLQNAASPPQISARSAIVIDAKTGLFLYQKNPDLRHPPASTTKLMTALVALERCQPTQIVKIQPVVKEGTQMGLEEGDQLTVENLLYGLLVSSGNDAAYALSNACSASYDHFVAAMNQKAQELSMVNTHFVNSAGFDDPGQYTTSRDLAKLAKVAVANPLIAKIVNTQSTVVTDYPNTKTYYLKNINKLLGHIEGLVGIKTGQTEASLEILVTKTTREENTIIAAVLGSQDRFGESAKLIEWSFSNYQWHLP